MIKPHFVHFRHVHIVKRCKKIVHLLKCSQQKPKLKFSLKYIWNFKMSSLTAIGTVLIGLIAYAACSTTVVKQVKLYDGTDFQGLIWQGPPSLSIPCKDIHLSGRLMTSSLITNVCIMAFTTSHCDISQRKRLSFTFLPGKYSDLSKIRHHSQDADNVIQSFRECKDDEGLNKNSVHVELFNNRGDLLVEYFNMNECINLPLYALSKVYVVRNHGSCVTLYNSTDCVGNSVNIQAGVSSESENLNILKFDAHTKSVAPCNKMV